MDIADDMAIPVLVNLMRPFSDEEDEVPDLLFGKSAIV